MAISEKICWRVLKSAKAVLVSISLLSLGENQQVPRFVNAIGIAELEKELVLHYCRQDIEDSLCFLEKR